VGTKYVGTILFMSKTSEIKIRVEPELQERFKLVCDIESRSVSAVIRELLTTYVEKRELELQQDMFADKDKTGS
tara:strand:- start:1189 stop:1410 length:222 start_codon:yes stop_codon:yes gene_type:complete